MSANTSPQHTRGPLAHYSNYFEVGHNPYEFLIDFGQFQPDVGEVLVHTRIVLSPTHAKLLLSILRGAVGKHEEEHGLIADVADSTNPLEVVKQSLPEFERRAVEARRDAGASAPAPKSNSSERR